MRKSTVRFAQPGSLAGLECRAAAVAADGVAGRQTHVQHRRKRHGHAVSPRLVGQSAAGRTQRRIGRPQKSIRACPRQRARPVLRRPRHCPRTLLLASAGIDKSDLSGVTAFDVRGNLTERSDSAAQPDRCGGLPWRAAARRWTPSIRQFARQFDKHLNRTGPEACRRRRPGIVRGARGRGAIWGVAWALRRRSGLYEVKSGKCETASGCLLTPDPYHDLLPHTTSQRPPTVAEHRRRLQEPSWGLAAATLLLLLGDGLDLVWELTPECRISKKKKKKKKKKNKSWAAGVCGVSLLCALFLPQRSSPPGTRASCGSSPRAPQAGRPNLPGWELAEGRYGLRDVPPTPLCPAWPRWLSPTRPDTQKVPLAKAAPLRPLGRSPAALGRALGRGGRAGGLPARPGMEPMAAIHATVRRHSALFAVRVHGRAGQRPHGVRP